MVSSRLIVVKGLNRTNRIVSTGRSWHLTGPESTHATNMVWPDTSPISKLYRGNLYSNGLKRSCLHAGFKGSMTATPPSAVLQLHWHILG
jgi:hypothetical protein